MLIRHDSRPGFILLAPVALLAATLLLYGCSPGQRASVEHSPVPGVSALAGDLPPLPDEQGVARSPSVNLNLTLNGDEFLDTNAQETGDGELDLVPNEGGVGPLAWATYRFSGVAPDAELSTLSVALSDLTAEEEYYLAIADYSAGAWHVVPVLAQGSSGTFSMLDHFGGSENVSPLGNVHLAVLTYNLSVTIEFLSLQGSGSLGIPQNLSATDLESEYWVDVTWDLVPGAEGYEVFYKEADQPDDFYGFLGNGQVNEGRGYFTHTEFSPMGKTAVWGVQYEYKVRATADGEEPSPFSVPDAGTRGYKAPHFLEATDQAYEDKVLLLWFAETKPGEDEWSYGIVRDNVLFDIVTVSTGGGGVYLDTTVDDFAEHEYRVHRGSAEIGFSLPSPGDTGSRAKWEHTTLLSVDTGDPTYADMEVSPVDPARPAVACFLQNLTSIYYGYDDPESYYLVVQAGLSQTMELMIHDGRPWIAYANQSPVYDSVGLKLARAKVSAPKGIDDWDVVDISDCDVASDEVAMEVIGGRPAIMFCEDVGGSEYWLRYVYATTIDPREPGDWVISDLGNFSGSFQPQNFDIADRQGFPVAVYQNLDGLSVMEASTIQPAGPQDWSEYPVAEWWDPGNPSGVDLSIHDGQAYIAYCEGGFEDPGRTVMTYTLNWPPTEETDWFNSSIADFNNEVVKGASLQFYNGRPWFSWSHSGDRAPFVASHIYRTDNNPYGTWGAGAWLYQPLLLPAEYSEARYETTLLVIDGSLSMLYVANNDLAGDPYELRYGRLLPPEVP